MARTLGAELLAAQDNISRRPLVEILSQQATAEIPFDGQRLNSFEVTESSAVEQELVSNLFYHSSGRIVGIYADNESTNQYYKFFYSDTNRTEWTYVDEGWSTGADYVEGRVHIAERTSDNNLIIAYRTGYSGFHDSTMCYAIVTPTGSLVTSGEIVQVTYQDGLLHSTPTVAKVGANYWYLYFYKNPSDNKWDLIYRTSTDGATWGSENTITLTGLDDTKEMANPSLFVATSGDLVLTFDYEVDQDENGTIKYDIFHTQSSDSGSTWTTISNITDDDTAGINYYQSRIVEYSNEDVVLAYTKQSAALVMQSAFTDPLDEPGYLMYDHVNRDLYVVHSWALVGLKSVQGMSKVDIDTWTITKEYDENSTPSMADVFVGTNSDHWWPEAVHMEYPYIVTNAWNHIQVFSIENETFTDYHFEDNATFSISANMTPEPTGMNGNYNQYYNAEIKCYTVDATNDKLWIVFGGVSSLCNLLTIGYIDLTEIADGEGNYSWHEVVTWDGYINGKNEDFTSLFGFPQRLIIPGDGIIYWATRQNDVWLDTVGYYGAIFKFSESSGGHIESIHYGNKSGMPKNGMRSAFWHDRKIYGGVLYTTAENQGDRSGVAIYDVDLGTTRYVNMPEGIGYYGMRYNGVNGLMLYTNKGLYVMDLTSEVWTAYTASEIPNLPTFGSDTYMYCVPTYNSVDGIYYVGNSAANVANYIAAIPENGRFEQGYYIDGTIQGDDTYVWGTPAPLTIGLEENNIDVAIDDNDSLWAVWAHYNRTADIHYVMWDNEAGIFTLTDYLVAGKEVEAKWSIAEPGQLKFTVSHGHLFDASNVGSILSMHLKKGRKLTLRYGEDVNGNYWEEQGTFFITENKMSYQRDQYPTMTVVAKDRLAGWQEGVIRATQHFSEQYPETIATSLITSYAEDYLTAADYDFPNLGWRHTIWHQFVDRTLWEMLEVLGDHFGFTPYVDMDGVIKLREIDFTRATDHAYADTTAVINYSPNDEYSTLVNRITVLGETRSFTEVTYAYERMGNVSGTTGWWGDDSDKRVWYSEDGTLEAVNPYMVVNESTDEFEIFVLKGGGGEQISDIDQLNRYVDIEIESPNLVGVFIGTLAAFIALAYRSIKCTADCGPYIFGTSILSSVLINILGAVARYDIDIYAQPIGRERRSVQATADDVEFQAEIGRIVEDFIDDPMAYTQESCQTVADREISYASAQRKRISFEKVTHLQDEVGDVITLPHPQSAETVKLMITEISRVLLRPTPGGTSGHFKDKIEGWRIT